MGPGAIQIEIIISLSLSNYLFQFQSRLGHKKSAAVKCHNLDEIMSSHLAGTGN